MSRRAQVDAGVRSAVEQLLVRTNALALLRAKFGAALPLAGAADGADSALVDLLVGGELPRPAGAAVVDDWDCLRVRGRVERVAMLAQGVAVWGLRADPCPTTPPTHPLTPPLATPRAVQGMVAAWERACGPLDQYGMRHSRAFANLCNAGLRPAALGAAAAEQCRAVGAGPKLIGPDAHLAASK